MQFPRVVIAVCIAPGLVLATGVGWLCVSAAAEPNGDRASGVVPIGDESMVDSRRSRSEGLAEDREGRLFVQNGERAGREVPGETADGDEELSNTELQERAREREIDGSYPYHDQPRAVEGELECPDIELVEYEGEVIPYHRPLEINPEFRERLVRFEEIARSIAVEIYGRPPDRLVHRGGHDCKTVGDGEELSEHAFGHAIDVVGFDFEATGEASDSENESFSEAFEVRVGEHWSAESGRAAHHREFLRRLARALERRGPFSTMLGPAYPNHDEIFHFDFGPEFFFRL